MDKQHEQKLPRDAAKESLAHTPSSLASARSAEDLLHELHVHQIELEMQNEDLRQSQLALEKSRDRYANFYDFAPVGYLTLTGTGLISEINLTGAKLLGVERSKLLHQHLARFVAPEDSDRWYRHFQSALKRNEKQTCEVALKFGDGSKFYAQLDCLHLINESKEPEVRIVLTDVTERRKMEDEIHHLAFYDALTKLPNRRLLNDRLAQAMIASKRSGRYCVLMFMDLDNFKPLNDQHGHAVGDMLLVEAAYRISNCVRGVDTVSRFGGDEFVVILSELDIQRDESMAEAGSIAEKIRIAMAEPYVLRIQRSGEAKTTVVHHCTSSIGMALFINHEISAEDILKHADLAMYQAKNGGRNLIRFFDSNTPMESTRIAH